MAAKYLANEISARRVPLRKPAVPEDIADARVRDMLGEKGRCEWAQRNENLKEYHDDVWGERPENDHEYFERMMLEVFHAGLSWTVIWNKRSGIRRAFDCFDVTCVAEYGPKDIERLMSDPDVIRSEKKIVAAVANAQIVRDIQDRHGSFESFLMEMPDGDVVKNKVLRDTFSFVGPGTARGFLESTGLEAPPHHPYCFKARRHSWASV
jgi:DNA-3-methyladenine glycosylase I